MGGGDRLARVVLGVAIVAVGIHLRSWWGLVGIVLLGTAAARWCPFYAPFGFSTCRVTRAPRDRPS